VFKDWLQRRHVRDDLPGLREELDKLRIENRDLRWYHNWRVESYPFLLANVPANDLQTVDLEIARLDSVCAALYEALSVLGAELGQPFHDQGREKLAYWAGVYFIDEVLKPPLRNLALVRNPGGRGPASGLQGVP